MPTPLGGGVSEIPIIQSYAVSHPLWGAGSSKVLLDIPDLAGFCYSPNGILYVPGNGTNGPKKDVDFLVGMS